MNFPDKKKVPIRCSVSSQINRLSSEVKIYIQMTLIVNITPRIQGKLKGLLSNLSSNQIWGVLLPWGNLEAWISQVVHAGNRQIKFKNTNKIQISWVFVLKMFAFCWSLTNSVLIVSIWQNSRSWLGLRAPICHVIGARSRGCPITGVRFELFVIGHL